MFIRLPSSSQEISCVDEVDEMASTCEWSKKTAEQLQKLNKDCNMTAGLEANLKIALSARVMLGHDIDTKVGLVNSAIGTVCAVSATCVTVKFDHGSSLYHVEMVRSRLIVVKNHYIYRKQFPLILSYAVTIPQVSGSVIRLCYCRTLRKSVWCWYGLCGIVSC